MDRDQQKGVAIIGMAGRFPGANNVDKFWENLCNGVESISFFSDEEVLETGVDPKLLKHPDYVKAWGVMDDEDLFDANYFGIPGREAEAMDPQHRHFLEVCVHALENSGYNPEIYDGLIGLICGVGLSTYLLRNLSPNADRLQALGEYLTFIGNDKDFMGTRVAYKLNLRGGVHSVSTACSTTMVGVHLACRQLLSYETDMAIAGGANIKLPQKSGYLYRKGHLKSPDGHCHAFDAKARGTVFGCGVAAVVLKRAQEALEDGDYIYGIIRASAINNDGNTKAGYTAPSVHGQTEVIMQAHELAGFDPETITHMEAHGTGTELGDPCEVKALTKVFRRNGGSKNQYCALTSVKTNVGHLDNVGGVAALIKLALTLRHKLIPPSLNFETPNPEIDFENSPFYVNTELKEWKSENGLPLRACISAFGAGGTNAHAVLEEAPELPASDADPSRMLLTLSAKSPTALAAMTANLAQHIEAHPEQKLGDITFTMNMGRIEHLHRRALVFANREQLLDALKNPDEAANCWTASITGEGEAQAEEVANMVATLKELKDDALGEKLEAIGKLWIIGAAIDWYDFYEGTFHHRLPLPLYPFESVRYWIDQPSGLSVASEEIVREGGVAYHPLNKQPIDQWFYEPSWSRASLIGANVDTDPEKWWMIFADSCGVGDAMAKTLREQGRKVILVTHDEEFEKPADDHYVIDARNADHYNGILTEMQNMKRLPSVVIHAWSLTANHAEDAALDMGFYSLIYLAQGLGAQAYEHDVQLLALSNRVHAVVAGDELQPAKAPLLAPVMVIPQEYPTIHCRAVDLVVPEKDELDKLAKLLIKEAATTSEENVIAIRGGKRWVRSWEKIQLPERKGNHPQLRENGTYLVTGGLGGIGLVLCEYLAQTCGANLVLTGRTELPPRERWDAILDDPAAEGPGARALRRVKYLEGRGATVAYFQADVIDKVAMSQAVSKAEEQFGKIDGIVHAAGVAEVGTIMHKTPSAAEPILAPKVKGSQVLSEIFEERELDFMVMCSSLATAVGGYSQVAYVGANLYQDALAEKFEDRNFIAFNWDAWKEVGMAVNRQTEDLQLKGIANLEGADAFDRALASGLARVAISTHDLNERIRQARAFTMDTSSVMEAFEGNELKYPRPEMSVPYVAPRTDLERLLVNDWQRILGLEKVGVDDDFFELGGDSLKGMNVINALEKRLGGVFHLEALFDTSTAAGLAEYLQNEHGEAVARLLGQADAPAAPAREEKPVTPKLYADFRSRIPGLPERTGAQGIKNRRAVFILAPPRSGSTLLRVVMAGHPGLIAPPELFMLSFNTVAEREEAFSGQNSFWKDGLIQLLMMVKHCAEPHARSIVEEFAASNATIKELYRHVQDLVGEDRLLVDKTPSYAYHLDVLERAEEDFHEPLYIHLQRHPHGMIHSYKEARLDVPLRHHLGGDLPFSSRQVAEMIWQTCHENIGTFLKDIPAERQHVLRFEDLVGDPAAEAEKLCRFLGLAFDPDMVNPYKEQRNRMTDGINSDARMLGDVKFHGFRKIEPGVADAWRKNVPENFLSEAANTLAESMGYAWEGKAETKTTVPENPQDLDKMVDEMSEEELDAMLSQMEQD